MATAKQLIAKAQSYIGVKESPANSNNVVFNTRYYGGAVSGTAYPWCCSFIWCLFQDCNAASLFYGGQKTAYCPTAMDWYKQKGQFHSKGKAGDVIFFDWSGNGVADHIGIVESVSGSTYTTIEGNTSQTSNDNGGAVMRRTRSGSSILGFGRPAYDGTESTGTNTSNTNNLTTYSAEKKATCTGQGVRIRKDAGTGYAELSSVSKGKELKVKGEKRGADGYTWYYLSSPAVGYMRGDYVSFTTAAGTTAKTQNGFTVGKSYTVQAARGVNVRSSAKVATNNIVTAIPKGTKITITDISVSGNYTWLRYSKGWVCGKEGSSVYIK